MPTLTLYEPQPIRPGASHRVLAPGGYEIWTLKAHDPHTNVRLLVNLICGDQTNPEYQRRFRQYLHRPTRLPPPVPEDFPLTRLVIAGLQHAERRTPHPAGTFGASDADEVSIVGAGDDRWTFRSDRRLIVQMTDGQPSARLECLLGDTLQCEGWIQNGSRNERVRFSGSGSCAQRFGTTFDGVIAAQLLHSPAEG